MRMLQDYSDEELNRLNKREIIDLKAQIWPEYRSDSELALMESGEVRIVAEGDSWFNYATAGIDILDVLSDTGAYRITRRATPGDTLENMIYGTKRQRWWPWSGRIQIDDVLDDIRKQKPQFFLFSGGGNDIAGDELATLLNHGSTDLSPLREEVLGYLVNTVFRSTYEHMFERIWKIDPGLDILSHGYAHPMVDGRGVGLWAFNFVGPWLEPVFERKQIAGQDVRDTIVEKMIDDFNEMLLDLDSKHPHFHWIDLRPIAQRRSEDWDNELHLSNAGYRRAAARFDDKMRELGLSVG